LNLNFVFVCKMPVFFRCIRWSPSESRTNPGLTFAEVLSRWPLVPEAPFHILGGKVGLGQICLRILRLSPVSIIPSMVQSHLHLNTTFIRRTSGRSGGTSKQRSAISAIGKHWLKKNFLVVLIQSICVSLENSFGLEPTYCSASLDSADCDTLNH